MSSLLSSATSRSISCRACGAESAVGFGPYGFLIKCAGCGAREHLDDMMEPLHAAGLGTFSVMSHMAGPFAANDLVAIGA